MITKALGWLLLLAAVSVSAQTNTTPFCCHYPLRTLVPGGTVDLTPLFQWWAAHGGLNDAQPVNPGDGAEAPRPLTAWKRITGIRTADLGDGWVVNAEVADSPGSVTNEWIVLRHPPATEEEEYYNLQALLAQDTAQINTDAHAQEEDLKAARRADSLAATEAADFSKSVRVYAYGYEQEAAQDRQAAAAALSDQKLYEQGRAQAQQRLKALPGDEGGYKLDCFALELGRNSKGQLVFDVGVADGYSR